jgi:hypothetical protein
MFSFGDFIKLIEPTIKPEKDSYGNYIDPNGGNTYRGSLDDPNQFEIIANPDYKPYIYTINTPFGDFDIPIDPNVGQFFDGISHFFQNIGKSVEGWYNISISLVENLPDVIANVQDLMLDVLGEVPGLIKFFTDLTVKVIREVRNILKNPTLLLLTSSTTVIMLLFVSLTVLTIAIKIWKRI